MILPLFDGVYISLVITNQLSGLIPSMIIGVFVFSGAASITTAQRINGNLKSRLSKLMKIYAIFFVLLILVTMLSYSISELIKTSNLRIFASLSIILISIRLVKSNKVIGELDKILFNPIFPISLGILASLDLSKPTITLVFSQKILVNSMIAGASAIIVNSVASLVSVPSSKKMDYLASLILIFISIKILGIF